MSKLTDADLVHARGLLENEGPASMYEYLGGKGDRYSKLAAGVVELKSLSGIAASSYMHSIAAKHDKQLSKTDVEVIMRGMADSYLQDMNSRLQGGVVNTEIDHVAASEFHSRTFRRSGLPDEAWTLYPVLDVLTEQGKVAYWNALRGFRQGIDKIDLSQTGIESFEALELSKVQRATINGLAQIHGVSVKSSALGSDGKPVELLYLDALDLVQVTRDDFILAQAGQSPATPDPTPPEAPGATLLASLAVPDIGHLIDSMAAFAPQAQPGFLPMDDGHRNIAAMMAVGA
ncbi:hypothetical protein [Pseudomonas putida]|nr:hypothetical protein [Pseudomonas putida]